MDLAIAEAWEAVHTSYRVSMVCMRRGLDGDMWGGRVVRVVTGTISVDCRDISYISPVSSVQRLTLHGEVALSTEARVS